MKKQKNINVWKIISISFIVLFFLMLVGKLAVLNSFKSSFSIPSEDQVIFAKYIVAEDLTKRGDNITNYEVSVDERTRKFWHGDIPKNMIQVYLSKNSTKQTYLLDVDNGEIIVRSLTEFYGSKNFPDMNFRGKGKLK